MEVRFSTDELPDWSDHTEAADLAAENDRRIRGELTFSKQKTQRELLRPALLETDKRPESRLLSRVRRNLRRFGWIPDSGIAPNLLLSEPVPQSPKSRPDIRCLCPTGNHFPCRLLKLRSMIQNERDEAG